MAFRKVFIVVFVQTAAIVTDLESDHACQQFTADKEVKSLIESKQELIEPCPCVRQTIELDYSYEKIGDCYRQWYFVDGVKQMCCYSPEGHIQIGAPQGGYMLFETSWKNISAVQRSCCLEEATCDLFYKINPSDDCSGYKPPTTVTSFGDPNIQTIDGNSFDFNGHGEYVFLKTSDLEIQVRLGYVTPGNKDATLFEVFSIFDTTTGDTLEVQLNRSEKDIHVYNNGMHICNASTTPQPRPCKQSTHCNVLAGGGKALILGCGVSAFAKSIEFTSGELMSVMIARESNKVLNITGLAGHQNDGNFVCRNGTEFSAISSASTLFDYGESWSLSKKSESHFNYSITGGNYSFYNEHHTTPRFLDKLLGNLQELFKGYSPANISLFNSTCRQYWDSTPNEQCLLTIARSRNYSLGLAVMATVNETHHRWELLNNRAPYFLEGMPNNITAIFKVDLIKTIDINKYVWDESKEQLTYQVATELSKDAFSLENGVFTWNVSTELRYTDTRLTFYVIDRFNASASHVVSINYCGCDDPSECYFDRPNRNSSENVIKAGCYCPDYFTGLYCETELDPCDDYQCFRNCSMTFDLSIYSWPCAPCPKGRLDVIAWNKQTCLNIDECAPDYSGEDKCEHNCTDTDGSFVCSCRSGYTLNADKHSCDDIDECKLGVTCLNGGTCVNFRGSWSCLCPPGFEIHHINESFIECQDIDECKLGATCSNGGTCVKFLGTWNCLCQPGFKIYHINESFIECQRRDMFSLEDAVTVKCTTSRWDISINMDTLKTIYPGVTARDIYLGQPHCHGNLENPTLKFRFSINDCKTTEIISGITTVYSNKLFYAVFDPVIPFIIRQHVWTFAVECDEVRGGAGTSHLHHGIDNHHETFINHYNVNVELFTDQNFLHPISGDIQTVHVGEDVYVKVSSSISDWNTKMWLHTCFTRPNRNATTDLEVLLISNGCEVDASTHIISQSTHETKFVFQDFEYVTNDEGLDVNCNATFCDSKDYSPGCVQSCVRNPALVG